MRCLCLSAVMLLVPLWVVHGAERGLFSIANAEVSERTLPGLPVASRTSVTREGETLVLTLSGDAGAAREFVIPVNLVLQADGEVRFNLQSANIAAAGNSRAALVLRLQDARGWREIELFEPTGASHSELGAVPLARIDGQPATAISVVARLQLREDGTASLRLRELTLLVGGNLPTETELEAALSVAPAARTVIQPVMPGGPRRIHVDGKPLSWIGYGPSAASEGASAAIELESGEMPLLQRAVLNLGGKGGGAHPPLLAFADYLDGVSIDAVIGAAAGSSSPVMLEVRFWDAPGWFTEGPVSDFNPRWMAYCKRGLDYLLAHVQRSAYAGRVIGITISLSPEQGGVPWPERLAGEQSESQFRGWLARRYPDAEGFQEAWKRKEMSLAEAHLLAPSQWPSGDVFAFLHPAGSQQAADSYRFFWTSWIGAHLELAAHVKDRTYGRFLTGIDGGSAAFLNANTGGRMAWPHDAVMELLRSPHVDLLEILADTTDVRPGVGAMGLELMLSNVARAHGKLLVVRQRGPLRQSGADDAAIQVRRRLLGSILMSDSQVIMSPPDGGLRRSGLLGELKAWEEIGRRSALAPVASRAQVAIVIDPYVFDWLQPSGGQDRGMSNTHLEALLSLPRLTWARFGAPFDIVLIDDLKPENYRMIVFYQIMRHTAARRRIIERCRKQNRLLAWVWSAGAVGDGLLSPGLASELVGIDLQWQPQGSRFFLAPRAALRGDLGIERIAGYFGWGGGGQMPDRDISLQFGPLFTIRDPEAVILADYADVPEPAMAMREHAGWTAFYSASPWLNPEVMRALARRAGVHLYAEQNDLLMVNDTFILLHTESEGVRTLTLPRSESLYELFSRRQLDPAEVHHLQLQGGTSYLFYRGSWADWLNPPGGTSSGK